MSLTYQPKKRKRKRVHGFFARKLKKSGQKILTRRRHKKRWSITV